MQIKEKIFQNVKLIFILLYLIGIQGYSGILELLDLLVV